MVPLDPEAEEVEHLEKSEEIQRRTLLGTQLLKRVVGEVYNSKYGQRHDRSGLED
ncbi:Os05g0116350 [Oryza sativa Japonica Group]|uniref:Os05g0116350 protein n=4 Tax=Oryza TaxID=4527 RepID=B9FM61_ORYSJ|nr:hypothetical protein OsI_18210 [Oryza sativa Indica Group]EEE62115.1 hypothetical protein OsJ_16899 [Oryza sativa Japonica Group]KAB8097844.1 hypothetical protein EE612_026689 [Oryza sativa]BAS91974.1 Os05g0116350 [Oryza sativa Japonica Group]